jgi:hypothetical protein
VVAVVLVLVDQDKLIMVEQEDQDKLLLDIKLATRNFLHQLQKQLVV